MTAAILVLGVLCVLLAVAVAFVARMARTLLDAERAARSAAEQRWADERRELLNRIQRPDLLPVARREPRDHKPPDAASYAAVGTVRPPVDDGVEGEDRGEPHA